MNKGREKFGGSEVSLLLFSAGDLIPMLRANKKLSHVKQSAFDYYDEKTKQFWQVQVTVTRNQDDFLAAFQTEEMKMFQPVKKKLK